MTPRASDALNLELLSASSATPGANVQSHGNGVTAGSLTMQLAKEIEMMGSTNGKVNLDIVKSDSEGASAAE